MVEQTPQIAGDRDRVFNAETCRALREEGNEMGQVLVPLSTVWLFIYVAGSMAYFSILPSWMEPIAGVVVSAIFVVAFIAELRWFGVSLDRETLRKKFHEMRQEFTREADGIAGDPEEIEARVLEENGEPTARPELAFGLPPEDCFIVFIPPVAGMVLAISIPSLLISVLVLGLTITFSGVRIAHIKTFGKPNTYSPEDPPHGRY